MKTTKKKIFYLSVQLLAVAVIGMYYFQNNFWPARPALVNSLKSNYTATYRKRVKEDNNGGFEIKDDPTIEEMFQYFHWPNSSSCEFAVDFGFHIYAGGDVQAPDGHKAVCLDPQVAPKYNNCVVYSFGINNEWTFDDAIAIYGCRVFSFDPSMGVDTHQRSERIFFYNIGLSDKNEDHYGPNGWVLRNLSSIDEMLERNHGVEPTVDVVKMDIEYSEWDVIPTIISSGLTNKIKQVAMEIHFHPNDTLDTFRDYYYKLRSLEKNGFYRFSSRLNPWLKRNISALGREDYIGFELAWYNSQFLTGNVTDRQDFVIPF